MSPQQQQVHPDEQTRYRDDEPAEMPVTDETPEQTRERLTKEMDDLLDDIDSVLIECGEDIATNYRQMGGQ
jgi:ubiquitin-like protein Pup